MAKDKKGKKGKDWEVRENARNWVPDEGGTHERFRSGNSQGKEPAYNDLPGLRNTGFSARGGENMPYASDREGRQYEYVIRNAMPEGGKFKDGEGNKFRENWQYVGRTPQETQYRGDDAWNTGGDDVWQRVITPIQKAQKQRPAPAVAAAAAAPGTAPAGATPSSPASAYVQPGPTNTRVTPGQAFLEDYLRNDPFQMDLSSAYASSGSGGYAFSTPATSLQALGSNNGRAWYDQML